MIIVALVKLLKSICSEDITVAEGVALQKKVTLNLTYLELGARYIYFQLAVWHIFLINIGFTMFVTVKQ